MKMYPFTCGTYVVNKGVLDNVGWGQSYEHPIPMFAFRHPKGVVVFDTGHNHRGLADPKGWYGKSIDGFLDIRITRDDCLPFQLQKAGIDPAEVTHVVLSHMHIDHAGEMTSFPKALFVVRASEVAHAWWPVPSQRYTYVFNDLKDTRQYDYLELPDGEDFDLFGDGSLVCVHTPGHTPGHQSLAVRLPGGDRPMLLCADACYGRANLLGAPASVGVMENVTEWFRTIQKVRHLERSGYDIWFGHDMEDWREKVVRFA